MIREHTGASEAFSPTCDREDHLKLLDVDLKKMYLKCMHRHIFFNFHFTSGYHNFMKQWRPLSCHDKVV